MSVAQGSSEGWKKHICASHPLAWWPGGAADPGEAAVWLPLCILGSVDWLRPPSTSSGKLSGSHLGPSGAHSGCFRPPGPSC
eukprot:6684710-Pyramimonas_sp.AAC.1